MPIFSIYLNNSNWLKLTKFKISTIITFFKFSILLFFNQSLMPFLCIFSFLLRIDASSHLNFDLSWLLGLLILFCWIVFDVNSRIWLSLIDFWLAFVSFKSLHVPIVLFQSGCDLRFHFCLHSLVHDYLVSNQNQHNDNHHNSHNQENFAVVKLPVH